MVHAAPEREVWITGVGLVSSQGEGVEPHLAALAAGCPPVIDATTFSPFLVHPAARVEWDRQVPKKSDQRQMEPWQKLGVYGAGLALTDAGVKDDRDLLARMHLIVAAGGGERDYAVDGQILSGLRKANDPGAYLNERLMSDLRPTLFLAQLSNLLAGNISIVHGVTGATRTFMGEEQAGVDAVRIAAARIAADQGDIFLVGGSYNAERPDVLLIYEMGGMLWKQPFVPVWERGAHSGGGFVPGSGAAFLVLESRQHAEARGARPAARLGPVAADRTRRIPGAVAASLRSLWRVAATAFDASQRAAFAGEIFSGATGLAGMTGEEQDALTKLAPGATVHSTGAMFGHMIEAQFPAGVALAAAAVRAGRIEKAAVTSVGHRRGEGLAMLARPW
jgi:3-oxoacyl-[acyl-carrier-protein] synthase II